MSDQETRTSDEMSQVPFAFAKYDYPPDERNLDRKAFAEKFFNQRCGSLHLNWSIDAYWKMVAEKVMIPYIIAIYDTLKERGYDENNKLMYGDADGDVFWLPAKDKNTKVFVHTNQCRDYLYIYTPTLDWDKKPAHDLHIRRIWRNYKAKSWNAEDIQDLYAKVLGKDFEHIEAIEQNRTDEDFDSSGQREFYEEELRDLVQPNLTKDEICNILLRGQKDKGRVSLSADDFIKQVLDSVEFFEELADDHSQYPQRPSLEFYRKRGFSFKWNDKDNNHLYGDCRDNGYIISLSRMNLTDLRLARTMPELELISTVYLPSVAMDLDITVNHGWSSVNGR